MTKFRTLAAVALAATTLTAVTATSSAFAWEGDYGPWRYHHHYRDYGYRDYGYRHYGYHYHGDCGYWHRWRCY
jgi:hypothetical protein